jgi:hypothetical protein
MVLGAVTYEMFAAFWPTASPEVEGEYTELMNRTPKLVLSKTLTEPLAWQSSGLNRGDAAAELPKLKQQPGRDIGIWDTERQNVRVEGHHDRLRGTRPGPHAPTTDPVWIGRSDRGCCG